MRFAHPEVLWLLLLLPVIGLFAWARLRAGRRRLFDLLSPAMAQRLTGHLAPQRQSWLQLISLAALLFLILAAAQPQRGTQYITATRQGVDVIVALDLSESMMAEDLLPNRLLRARHEISGIIDQLRGDRIGLIAFAGAAFVQCPLTLDYAAARMFLEFMGPDLIPEPGTSIAEAIEVATRAYNSEEGDFKALILITDGEDHIGEIADAVKTARKAGVKIFTVGIGSESGEPIPERDDQGEITGYKKDRDGKVILTRINEDALRMIADETGGIYTRAGGTLGLDRVASSIEAMEKRELEGGVRMLYEERYTYFLWPALILLLAGWAVPLRRRWGFGPARQEVTSSASGTEKGMMLSLLMIFLLSTCTAAQGNSQNPVSINPQHRVSPPASQNHSQPGQAPAPGSAGQMMPGMGGQPAEPQIPEEEWVRLLEENQIYRSENPGDPRPVYNLGNLFHLKGDLPEAAEFYGQAAPRAEGDLASSITYNLGNTLAMEGKLEDARAAFARSLFLNPANEDAKYNLELVQKMLDQAEQCPDSTCQQDGENEDQENQDQENQDQQDQENQDQQDQENQDQQNQDQQDQENQDQQNEEQDQEQQEENEQQQQNPDDQEQEEEQNEQSAADQSESKPDSTLSAEDMQLMQLLKGLEAAEKELLETRFQARSTNKKVEKDW